MQSDKAAIDRLTTEFFGAFANANGKPDVDRLYGLFIPEAIIVKNLGGKPEVFDVRGFVEPRRAILGDGSLTNFEEHEVTETTEVFGNIAQRFSGYTKSWSASGKPCTGAGTKSIQFVRTPDGWRICALAWDDA